MPKKTAERAFKKTRIENAQISGLESHLGYWLRFVSNHVSHAFMQKIEARGVTVAEWAVLRQMWESGAVNPSQLAAAMGMTRGAISKLAERLCVKQLVTRGESDTDRRYQNLSLTVSGRKLVPILAKLADENDREFFGHLTAETESQLVGLLRDIVTRQGWKDIPVA